MELRPATAFHERNVLTPFHTPGYGPVQIGVGDAVDRGARRGHLKESIHGSKDASIRPRVRMG